MFTMDRMVLLLLSLLWVMGVMGLQTIVYISQSCTWAEAQAYCRQHHSDLVTIRTEDDNNKITRNSWLGLYRDNSTTDWKWSRGGGPLTYDVLWHNNDPDNGKNCVFKQQDENGRWRSKHCTQRRKFYCDEEWLYLVKEKKTWEEAVDHCRAMDVIDPNVYNNHSYDLASLMTPEDHDTARELIQTAETEWVWTGLRFMGDRWMWVNGEEVQDGGFNSCPTVNRCGALDNNSTQVYSVRPCEERKNFLCYKIPI